MKMFFTLLLTLMVLFSCRKKQESCYDAALQESTKSVRCSSDCPGIIGCDGKTYCNECVAAMSGIRPK